MYILCRELLLMLDQEKIQYHRMSLTHPSQNIKGKGVQFTQYK